MIIFFFFKQKTAYEMRISDWSSDVCSSDLAKQEAQDIEARRRPREAEREGDKPPRPDDPRKPKPRPDALEDQVAGNLEDTIAEKEQRRAARKSVVKGKSVSVSVDLGCRRMLKKKNT